MSFALRELRLDGCTASEIEERPHCASFTLFPFVVQRQEDVALWAQLGRHSDMQVKMGALHRTA